MAMNRAVKICGLTREADVEIAIAAGADYLGFIVEAKSARRLSFERAARLIAPIKVNGVKTVAVMVNPSMEDLTIVKAKIQPDFIQLHGDESPDYIADIKRRLDIAIIKAIPIASQSDLKAVDHYAGIADLILLDAKPPKGSDIRGGHGITIDWSLIKNASLPMPYLLAGGLNSDNVKDAITMTKAPIVDVSSGVETAPGIKDPAKIKALIKLAKALST